MYKLFSLFFLCATLSFATQANSSEIVDYIVAVVNEDIVTHSELEQATDEYNTDLRQQNIRVPSIARLRQQVLEKLIVQKLQTQVAKRTGIEIDDNSLNAALRQVAAQNRVDLSRLRLAVEQSGYNFADYRENIRRQMAIDRLQQRYVVSRVNVNEQEIDNFLQQNRQTGRFSQEYHLNHILVAVPEAASPETLAEQRAFATQLVEQLKGGADFQSLAVEHSQARTALNGGDLGWRKSGELPALFVDSVQELTVGEVSDLIRDASGFHIIKLVGKRGGDKNIVTQTRARHILLKKNLLDSFGEIQDKLSKLKYRIENGDDFAELARASSEDPVSASNGGDLGWVNPGDMVPEFENVMNSLAINSISEPFESRFGWHIVQVLERREHDNTEQALRTRATKQIRQRKIDEELNKWLRQLRDEAYVEYRDKN